MRISHRFTIVAAIVIALSMSSLARAITLPDASSCSSSTQCLSITNTNGSATNSAVNGTASAGFGYGVRGNSSLGRGVYGTTAAGYGVRGNAAGLGYGIRATSVGGVGLRGASLGGTSIGTGVSGTSSLGNGVYGTTSGGASTAAIWSETANGAGTAVRAVATGTGNGAGLWASGPSGGYGVFGEAGGTGFGIYGVNQTGGWAGYFQGNVFTTGTYQGSDLRLKTAVTRLPYGMSALLKLRPVSYRWKGDNAAAIHLGLIAQEVRAIIPELVRTDVQSGTLSINYTSLVPVIIEAVQEQEGSLRRHSERLAALERRRPIASRLNDGRIAAATALPLLPIGIFIGLRRRRHST